MELHVPPLQRHVLLEQPLANGFPQYLESSDRAHHSKEPGEQETHLVQSSTIPCLSNTINDK